MHLIVKLSIKTGGTKQGASQKSGWPWPIQPAPKNRHWETIADTG